MDFAIELFFAMMALVIGAEFAVVMVGLFGSSRKGQTRMRRRFPYSHDSDPDSTRGRPAS